MDAREAEKYLARLYEPTDRIEVAYIKDGQARRVIRDLYDGDGNATLLAEFERAEAAGWNIYTGVLPVRLQATRTYDRVWVDQDHPEAPWPFGSDERWEGAAWPTPTTLVRTSEEPEGFRWQAIYRLRERLPEAEGRALIRRLAKKAGADESVIDYRRVLRVPGLMNAKRGVMARLVETSSTPVSIEAFDLPEESTVRDLLTMTVQNPNHVLGEWLAGTPEGERSRKAYVAARFLKGCGVTYTDAGAILKVGAMRCNPPFEDRELEHVLNSAFHRKES